MSDYWKPWQPTERATLRFVIRGTEIQQMTHIACSKHDAIQFIF